MDRSTPPIQYAPRNASRSNVVSLFMSSKESHAVFTVSRTLNSLHRTPESSFRFCFARSTFAVRSSVFLMLPNAGLAFAHAAGSVHSLRSSSSYRTGRKWGSVIAPSATLAAYEYISSKIHSRTVPAVVIIISSGWRRAAMLCRMTS